VFPRVEGRKCAHTTFHQWEGFSLCLYPGGCVLHTLQQSIARCIYVRLPTGKEFPRQFAPPLTESQPAAKARSSSSSCTHTNTVYLDRIAFAMESVEAGCMRCAT